MKKAIELANALSERYGSKYSFEGNAIERPYSKEEIDAIKAELLDKSILTLLKRLLGFGKKTGDIYAELMGKLTGLIRYLRKEISNLETELAEKEEELRVATQKLGQNVQTANAAVQSSEGLYLKFGDVIDRIDASEVALSIIDSEIPNLMKGDLVALPYVRSTEENLHFAIQYNGGALTCEL